MYALKNSVIVSFILILILSSPFVFAQDNNDFLEKIFDNIVNLFSFGFLETRQTLSEEEKDLVAFTRFALWMAVFAIISAVTKLGKTPVFTGKIGNILGAIIATISILYIPPDLIIGIGLAYGLVVTWVVISAVILGILWVTYGFIQPKGETDWFVHLIRVVALFLIIWVIDALQGDLIPNLGYAWPMVFFLPQKPGMFFKKIKKLRKFLPYISISLLSIPVSLAQSTSIVELSNQMKTLMENIQLVVFILLIIEAIKLFMTVFGGGEEVKGKGLDLLKRGADKASSAARPALKEREREEHLLTAEKLSQFSESRHLKELGNLLNKLLGITIRLNQNKNDEGLLNEYSDVLTHINKEIDKVAGDLDKEIKLYDASEKSFKRHITSDLREASNIKTLINISRNPSVPQEIKNELKSVHIPALQSKIQKAVDLIKDEYTEVQGEKHLAENAKTNLEGIKVKIKQGYGDGKIKQLSGRIPKPEEVREVIYDLGVIYNQLTRRVNFLRTQGRFDQSIKELEEEANRIGERFKLDLSHM